MKTAVLVTAVVFAALSLAMREAYAGTMIVWLALAAPYAALSALAVYRFHDDGTLVTLLRPRAGDITIGVVLGGALVGAGWVGRNVLFGSTSPKIAWLYRLALQLDTSHASPKLFVGIALVAVLEEIVWRGLVQGALSESVGSRKAWPLAAALYGVSHVGTVFTLADPLAGPNPLVALGALGCGLVWGFTASILGRLPPVMISHAVFTYFAVTVLLPRFG